MNLDNEELLVTKHKRKLISYTKQVASGKLDKNFYNAYCELYDLLCEYMNAYNRECADYEQTIQELYEEKESWRKKYFEDKTKVDLDKYEITIPLEDTGLEDIEYYYKKGDKWYAHYKEKEIKEKIEELHKEYNIADIKELKEFVEDIGNKLNEIIKYINRGDIE